MANTLDDLMPKILARGLLTLRKRLVMPTLVNRDYAREAASKGKTIDVPLPPIVASRAVVPGHIPVASPDITETTVKINLDRWEEAPIHFTDKEQLEVIDDAILMATDAAANALAEEVNESIMANFVEIFGLVGTPGTTPFATDYKTATAGRKVLNEQKAPLPERRMVVDPDAEESAINLSAFADSSFAASSGVIMEGDIGRKLGFDWFMDQQIPTLTNGTLSDGTGHQALVNGAPVLGAKSQAFDATALTGTVKKGEIFTVAGDTQTYVVTADATAAANAVTLSFEPGVKVVWADNAQMTLKGAASLAWVNNLAFNRAAFALAVRPLGQPQAPGSRVLIMIDSETGLPLRLEVSRQHKQDNWSFDILWGTKVVRPELAVRLAG